MSSTLTNMHVKSSICNKTIDKSMMIASISEAVLFHSSNMTSPQQSSLGVIVCYILLFMQFLLVLSLISYPNGCSSFLFDSLLRFVLVEHIEMPACYLTALYDNSYGQISLVGPDDYGYLDGSSFGKRSQPKSDTGLLTCLSTAVRL